MTDWSISVASSIVADLARLDPDRLRLAVEYAKAERRRRIRSAVREVQAALLPGWKNRRAAQAIADAAQGRRASFRGNTALRAAIEHQLKAQLGSLDDLPGESRIRQLLRE